MSKKVLLSGIQPSGRPHIGNYFGMMRQLIAMQDDYQVYAMIVDYHALNTVKTPAEMRENIKGILLDYLALGFDPTKSVIFKQSDVKEHTELAWIFETLTTMPYLMRAHAFKDAEAKNKEISVGTFNYPMLMAADILLYDTDIVPVGADQKQHVEIARDTALKFNNAYGETFKLPDVKILEEVSVVPGLDGRKMSKSYGNTIPLFAEPEELKKLVMSIVTDSSGGVPENVFAIHKLIRDEKELEKIYAEKAGKYKELKEMLAEDLENFIAPLREKRKELEKDIDQALEILKVGGENAREIASARMTEVKNRSGVAL